MLAEAGQKPMSKQELDALLRHVVVQHSLKLDRIAAVEKSRKNYDVAESKANDRVVHWAYKLLDARGSTATVKPDDHAEMNAAGLTLADIANVETHLTMLRVNELVPTKPEKLAGILQAVGAPATAANLSMAQAIYFQGMKMALAQSARRYDGVRSEEAQIAQQIWNDLAGTPTLAPGPSQVPEPGTVTGTIDEKILPDVAAMIAKAVAEGLPKPETLRAPAEDSLVKLEGSAESVRRTPLDDVPLSEIVTATEGIIAEKDKYENWDVKTQRQVRSSVALLLKYLQQEKGLLLLSDVRQAHVAGFATFLKLEINKKHGRSSKDEMRPIAELRGKSEKGSGLSPGTVKRHIGHLHQVFAWMWQHERPLDKNIDIKSLAPKEKKSGRTRDDREKLKENLVAELFRQPPFINCANWKKQHLVGLEGQQLIYHGALYFVPMLIYYGGGRREEYCGLLVDDVITDNGIPYIHVSWNDQRRIKNDQSSRNIVLHSELIRLGFLLYVAAIKALGYKLLFPDIYSPTTQSPMGDKFYKVFRPVLDAAEIRTPGVGAHAIRHFFNSGMKKQGVNEEDRAELMGHGGSSETTERYCEPHELHRLLELVQMTPIVTGHLEPQPINLVPWVAQKLVAPFSHPSRSKAARRRNGK